MSGTNIPSCLRRQLVLDSRGFCTLCHREAYSELHHIIPESEGGPTDYENLIPLCKVCHGRADQRQITRAELRSAKRKWCAECQRTITRIIASDLDEVRKIRALCDSYDGVCTNPDEQDSFKKRLEDLEQRQEVFRNFFSVLSHKIRMEVRADHSCVVLENLCGRTLVEKRWHTIHINGDNNDDVRSNELGFTASLVGRARSIECRVEIAEDSNIQKSFRIHFPKALNPTSRFEIEFGYTWPNAYSFSGPQRYTYDVFGWSEKVDYRIKFPKFVQIKNADGYLIDLFGRQWNGCGKGQSAGNELHWGARRLPMFSTMFIHFVLS